MSRQVHIDDETSFLLNKVKSQILNENAHEHKNISNGQTIKIALQKYLGE